MKIIIKNSSTSYGLVAKVLHWVMATLFIGMFTVAYVMINMSKSPLMYSLYDLHKATGLLLFSLVAIRLIWRFVNLQPSLPHSIKWWQRMMAKVNVLALYFFMIAMPITGFLTSTLGGHAITFYRIFTIQPLAHNKTASLFFSQAHELLSYLLLIAFALHLFGAIYHHYFLKDLVFKRMWFNSRDHYSI